MAERACRHVQLLQYLGETMEPGLCKGRCDNCLSRQGHNPHSSWYSKVRSCPASLRLSTDLGQECCLQSAMLLEYQPSSSLLLQSWSGSHAELPQCKCWQRGQAGCNIACSIGRMGGLR